MTKDQYLEMCEALGTVPDKDQMPADLEDLTSQTQEVVAIFNYLPDKWDSMAGAYLGKDLSNILTFFEVFDVHKKDMVVYLDLLAVLIEEQIKFTNNKLKSGKGTSDRQDSKN